MVKLLMMSNFSLWPQCFQLYLTIKLSFMQIFQVCVTVFSKSSAADLLYVGKGLKHICGGNRYKLTSVKSIDPDQKPV